jgi:predicted peptidase
MQLLTLSTALILAVSASAADDYSVATFTGSKGGLPYRILSPATPEAEVKYPLVIFLHGAGERGDSNTNQLDHGSSLFSNPGNREKYPAFVIFPPVF